MENMRLTAARRLAVPGVMLLAVSFALVGCSKGSDSPKEGPITSRMNALYNGDGGNEKMRAENDRHEEIVASCMKEKGFEYTPVKMDDDAFGFETYSDEDWDPVAEAKENGYHITPVSKDALIAQYGLGEPTEEEIPEEPMTTDEDPNSAYYSTLSANDQVAYDEALYGVAPDDGSEYEYDWKTAGCSGEAFHQVYESQIAGQGDEDSTLMDDYYTFTDEKASNDSRVVDALSAWVTCMADKDYDFADFDEAVASIQKRFDDLTGTDSTSEEWVDPDPDLFSDEDITALHDDEVATATADAQCTVSSGWYDAYEEAWADAETEFYNSHKAEVDAWFAAQEALLNPKG